MRLRARSGAVAVAAAGPIEDDGTQWIEVMPTADKARNGPFYFTVTADDLEVYADFIKANPERIPIDYDHDGADGGSTVAAGWFTGKAEVRETDDGPRLFALVEWTPQARQEIADKRFRFVSPEFSFAKRDKKTGLMTKAKELLAATLTNRPFFAELAALATDITWGESVGYLRRASELAEALNGDSMSWRYYVVDITDAAALVCEGDDYWTVPYTVDENGELQVSPSTDWTALEQQYVPSPEEAAEAMARLRKAFNGGTAAPTERNDSMDPKILAALGLPEDADDEAVLAAVTAAKSKPEPEEGDVVLSKDTLATLTASAAKGETAFAQLQTLKIDTLLDQAVRDFKILPVQKEAYAAMASADFDQVKKLIDDTPRDAFKVAAMKGAGGDGDATPASDKVRAARRRFASELADPAPVEQAELHVKAEEILTAAGKGLSYTADEYLSAHAQAELELGVAYVDLDTLPDGDDL